MELKRHAEDCEVDGGLDCAILGQHFECSYDGNNSISVEISMLLLKSNLQLICETARCRIIDFSEKL